ncbi:hypothetical protein FQA47_017043 [Oryzias melastigma]|uniref:Uncharacterized protein n=1 Tax=Oryzias melastigma TaxID=30732 RepID=A0A834C2R4_ORYME|nr:hypothetical protein FQA47_017043 [Oryzias melastigma]
MDNILHSSHGHHRSHRWAKGVDSTWETMARQPLTSPTASEWQRVIQRTWQQKDKSISLLPFHHRPACSDSKMSCGAFQNPHLFGWEQGIGGCVCFKGNAEESIFLYDSTPALHSVFQCLC